jgi:hypothetical protein
VRPVANRHLKHLAHQKCGHLQLGDYLVGQGWFVECDCGRWHGYVLGSRKLTSGQITACPECRPDRWSGKRGRKPDWLREKLRTERSGE